MSGRVSSLTFVPTGPALSPASGDNGCDGEASSLTHATAWQTSRGTDNSPAFMTSESSHCVQIIRSALVTFSGDVYTCAEGRDHLS